MLQNLLQDRVAPITGGASGMGEATAKLYAQEGAISVIMDMQEERAQRIVKEIEEAGGRADFFNPVDVSDQDAVNEYAAKVVEKYGRIDILCAYAGATFDGQGVPFREMLQKTTEVNQWGMLFCCYAVAPYMKEQKSGVIIICSSNGAFNPTAPAFEYHMSKAANESLAVNLAMNLAPDGIRVYCIKPGAIVSPYWNHHLGEGACDHPELEIFQSIARTEVPLGRTGVPQDIANVALCLASDLFSYVTGLRIYVAGGQGYVYAQAQTAAAQADFGHSGIDEVSK